MIFFTRQIQSDDDEDQVTTSDDHDGTADLGFGSSKPGHCDKDRNLIMTVVDWSGVHEIGVSWCHCPGALKHDMQLMMAGLFPATFHKPKTAFTFRVLEDYHLDNLECKTTTSQYFRRRLTNDKFPNTVPVWQFSISVDGRLMGKLRTDIGSCWGSADSGGLSFPKSDLALDIEKVKIRHQDQWLYSVPHVRNLKLTSWKIGESTKIGESITIVIS